MSSRSGITVASPERTQSSGSTVMLKIPTTDSTSIHRVWQSDNPIEEPKMVLNDHEEEEEDSESIKDEDNEDEDEDIKNENASDNKIAEEINEEEDEDRSNDEVDNEIKEIKDKGNGIENKNDGNDVRLLSHFFLLIYCFLTSMPLFFIFSATSNTVIGSMQAGESIFF